MSSFFLFPLFAFCSCYLPCFRYPYLGCISLPISAYGSKELQKTDSQLGESIPDLASAKVSAVLNDQQWESSVFEDSPGVYVQPRIPKHESPVKPQYVEDQGSHMRSSQSSNLPSNIETRSDDYSRDICSNSSVHQGAIDARH